MKKRILSLALAIVMVAATLIGCGNNKDENVTPNTEVTTETSTNVTPEVDTPETSTNEWTYSGTLTFPEGTTGFTEKFLNETEPDWSKNKTHYVSSTGTEMNFLWEGPKSLGENVGTTDSGVTLTDKDNNYMLQSWHGGSLKLEEVEECYALDKNIWTSLDDTNTFIYPENGYYNVEKDNNVVYVTYAIKTNEMTGYAHFICNGEAGNYYMFRYLEKNEIYDNDRAMEVVKNIAYWSDYEETN